MRNKRILLFVVFLFAFAAVSASDITFSGGFTRVSLRDGNNRVELSGGARAATEDIQVEADRIELYGEDYSYVDCTGNVRVREEKRNITIKCSSLFYNRTDDTLFSDGWIEIEDLEHEAKLSGAWLDYSTQTSIMTLQMHASIQKDTSSGLLECTADSIEYNGDSQMLTLRGNARVTWGDDSYSAAVITVNLDTEDITLQGSITGELNG